MSAPRTSETSVSRPLVWRKSMYVDNFPGPVSITSGSIAGRCDAVISNTSAPCTARVRNDACQVEYLDARERAIGRGQGLRGCIANLIHGKEWKVSDCSALGMLIPLCKRSTCGD